MLKMIRHWRVCHTCRRRREDEASQQRAKRGGAMVGRSSRDRQRRTCDAALPLAPPISHPTHSHTIPHIYTHHTQAVAPLLSFLRRQFGGSLLLFKHFEAAASSTSASVSPATVSPLRRPSLHTHTMVARTLYCSTRGGVKNATFEEVVLGGLAPDRGLYVPQVMPTFTYEELEGMRSMTFPELAFAIVSRFVGEEDIPAKDLKDIIDRSYSTFRTADVSPVKQVGSAWILELFHGPTFAFKDVALQLLGNLFEYFLSKRSGLDGFLTILGATSGDTGSAAIYGLRGKANVRCFILYPKGRTSAIQERQMTTVPDKNVQCIAIEGTFDDCQNIVKAAFQDKEFREEVRLGAVNSINWARVLAQITYYYWAYFRITDFDPSIDKLSFSVPTGNFGDVLAGYYAKRMGLPVEQLLVATNVNDILHRFFETGNYHKADVTQTHSPSMDISISSNFERYLFELAGRNHDKLKGWMTTFEATGELSLEGDLLEKAREDFISGRGDEEQTLATMRKWHEAHGYLLCPHSAVGVHAADSLSMLQKGRTVCLATAHPAKFPEATERLGIEGELPKELAALADLPMRSILLKNDLEAVQSYMKTRIPTMDGKE